MNISSISTASVRSLVSTSTSATSATVSSEASAQSSGETARSSGGATASAPPGFASLSKSMSKLEELATSDPDAFKAAAAEIADKLRNVAGASGGAGPLSDLADRFEAAATSGDASGLAPSGPPPGGQGPHGPPPDGAQMSGRPHGPPPGGGSGAQRASDAYRANSLDNAPDFSALAEIINSSVGGVTG